MFFERPGGVYFLGIKNRQCTKVMQIYEGVYLLYEAVAGFYLFRIVLWGGKNMGAVKPPYGLIAKEFGILKSLI